MLCQYDNTENDSAEVKSKLTDIFNDIKQVSLVVNEKIVKLNKYTVSATIPTEQETEINSRFGIDVNASIDNVIHNEFEHSIEKLIFDKMKSLAEQPVQELTFKQKFLKKCFGYSPSIFVDPTNIHTIIVEHSNILAKRNRIPTSKMFLITNMTVASTIQNSVYSIHDPINTKIEIQTGLIYKNGSIANLKVFTNAYMKMDETEIIFGFQTENNQEGIHLIEGTSTSDIQQDINGRKIKVLTKNLGVESTPNAKFISLKVSLEKETFFKYIKAKIRNKISEIKSNRK